MPHPTISISCHATTADSACAQAVRQISDKITIKELKAQYVYVKFYCKLGKNFTETSQLVNEAYGEDVQAECSALKRA